MSRPVRRPKHRPHLSTGLLSASSTVLVVVLVIAAIAFWTISWESTETTSSCTVMSTDRATKKDGKSDMRVYTDCGTFSVADDPWQRQWASADTFGSLQAGHTYRLHAIGWRTPFLSMFPNILWTQELHGE